MFNFLVGVDLGEVNDYTAVVIMQRREVLEPEGLKIDEYRPEMHQDLNAVNVYDIRHIERLPLGTQYPDVVHRVRTVLAAPELEVNTTTIVDQTGVGRPVVEMMQREGISPLIAINITGGTSVTQTTDNAYNVPKKELVSALQILLQSGRLKIASALPEAEVLKTEILNFRVKVKPETGAERFEAWRAGDHDDLVLAAAMVCWYAHNYDYKRRLIDESAKPEPGWDPLRWGLED